MVTSGWQPRAFWLSRCCSGGMCQPAQRTWGESGLELDDRTDHYHQEGQQEGQVVGHPVGAVILGGFVIEACQDARQECPKGDGFGVGDVECLPTQGRVLGEAFCSQNMSVNHVLHEGEVHHGHFRLL